MESEKRGQGSSVTRQLTARPYSFNFFQAVHLLEEMFPEKERLGVALSPKDEPVRFRVQPGFAFPASEISALRLLDDESRAEMEVSFMGLVGPTGILPRWYNELAVERGRDKDAALIDFLNIFHHRLISLFYLAWKRAKLSVTYQPFGTDRASSHLKSLIGLGTGSVKLPQGIDAESLLYFSGLIARRSPSVTAIESAVSHHSGQRTAVQQFIERTIELPENERTLLGRSNATLGENTLCGSHVWENTSKFRIRLGPMDSTAFSRFLPGGGMLHSIFKLVRFIVGIEYEFDVCLVIKREQISPCRLGEPGGGAAPFLGWSTWLTAHGYPFSEDQMVIFQETDLLTSMAV